MAGEIILNLDLPEYQDDFHSPENGGEQNGLWQQEANKTLVSHLDKMGRAAKDYKKNVSQCKNQATKLSSYHHAIFISGARGTGKTVFLRNIQAVWDANKKKHVQSASDLPDLHFIDAIDPTLLNIHDRFSEVIIASVYAAVEKNLKLPKIDQEKKDGFYSALKILSGALGVASEFDEYRGIDRLQKYRSGIHLEKYFHKFLIASVDLLDCDALVLPIDDVDMKIDNAFGVLDDIRCILSCPLILPLVSGDDDLYRHITTMQFEGSLAKNSHASNFNEGKIMAERLSKAYLTKVFPNHTRLPLVPISQLLSKLKIRSQTQNGPCTFSEYESKIKRVFYPLCNGQERSTDWPKPDSAREVTQLVRLLTPSQLDEDKTVDELWRKFSIWAEEKQDGIALTNAESFLKVRTMQSSEALDLNSLIAFNPLLQKNRYSWAKKDFYTQQINNIADLKAHKTNKGILDTVFSQQYESLLESRDYTLRSLPPLELIMEPLFLSKEVAEKKDVNNKLLAIYTYNNYYSRQHNRRYHIFFSRAFEVLAWSLLAVTGNLPKEFSDKKVFKEQFKNMFLRAPFYSIFALNPTRIIDEDGEDDPDFDDSSSYSEEIDNIGEDIYNWSADYAIPSLAEKNFIPLMSVLFNKTFSQLNVLRKNLVTDKKQFKYEHLSDLACRFEYIFINSLTSFLRDGIVINTNVATGARSSLVRDFDEFNKYDRTLSKNLDGILHLIRDDNKKELIKHENDYIRLIVVMTQNPVFELGHNNHYLIGNSRGEGKGNLEKLNVLIKSMDFPGVKSYYLSRSGKNSVKINDVESWAALNVDEARLLYNKIINDEKISSAIDSGGQIEWMYKGLARGLGLEE
ncbi:hypothetical protein VW41_12845 [Klebsiella michiganensis]|nr:hypothetical protein VW41_12845 [Klebsiella michiganensis]